MSKKSVLVVASLAYDGIETIENKVDNVLGGAGTYICLSLKNFSSEYSIVSVVGKDFKEEDLNLLKSCGVDISGIKIEKNNKTFYWSCIYTDNFKERITTKTELNVMESFNPIISENKSNPDILLLGNLHPEIQLSAINQLNNKPSAIILDTMNYWIENFWDTVKEVISNVDIISINDEEARQLTGEYSLVKAAEKIHELGPQYIIIKKGEHGALLFHDSKIFCAPALPLEEVFDPTGAGDSFAGGFTGYLTQTGDISFRNMKSAVIYASAMASFTVEKFGTESLINYSSHSMDNRLKAFKELTTFDIEIQ